MDISSASYAYPQHEGDLRAALARLVDSRPAPPRCFVLSTCLRLEVVVPGPEPELVEALDILFGDVPEASDPVIRSGGAAVEHLYRVAAGLESPILGEQEVLTQFRQTLIQAEDEGRVGGIFGRLLEGAVAAGREARERLPGSPHNSMAAVAAQAVGPVDRVAVFGSGIVATSVMEGLMQLPAPPAITVVARHPDKVPVVSGIEVLGFEHAAAVLETFPAVISATSSKNRLIDEAGLSEILDARDHALLLVDMAMPPDFHPRDDGEVTYVDIDDLARMADRRPRSVEADELVTSSAAEAHRRYRDHHEVGPLIGQLVERADYVVNETVARFKGRLADPGDEAVLLQTAHTAARTLLAGPVAYLNTGDRSAEAIDVIAEAFGVDGE